MGFCSISVKANELNNTYVYKLTQHGAVACLASAVFYEANLESMLGKQLVAISILNRAVKRNKTICVVLSEPHQFSFYKVGFDWSRQALHKESLQIVLDILRRSMLGLQPTYSGITYFHAVGVSPSWASSRQFKLFKREGNHMFYIQKESK